MTGVGVLLLTGYLLSGAFCKDYTVKMPKHIEAVGGSCVLIPCTFDLSENYTVHLKSSSNGVWIKHRPQFAESDSLIVFNSSATENNLSGEIVGDLVQKNCTTVLDQIPREFSDKYYFRIEASSFRATFSDTPVNISVTGSPKKPSITKLKELKEGTSVGLKCTAAAPCVKRLPVLAWSPVLGNSLPEILQNSDGTMLVSSVLTFTPRRHHHHRKTISCSAEYTLNDETKIKVDERMTLEVLFPPKNTTASIHPSGPLLNGSPVTLTCQSSAHPPVSDFTWFRVGWIRTTWRGSGQTLAFNASSRDVGWFYCEARNSEGKQESDRVKLAMEGVWEPLTPGVIGGIVATLVVLLAVSLLLIFCRLRMSAGRCGGVTLMSREELQSWQQRLTVATLESGPSSDPSEAVKTRETPAVLESQQEEFHYAEVQFSKQQAKEKAKRGKEDTRGQDIEYAAVNFSERKKASIEDVYAKVKPKNHPK